MLYLVSLLNFTGILALFALGLNLQWGFAGLVNFGHVAFLAIGAYTTVLLSLQGWPLLLGVAIAVALATLLGTLVGFTTLRLREDYLAIVTIGLSEVLRAILTNEEWLTRGTLGIQRYPLPLANLLPRANYPIALLGLVIPCLLAVLLGLQRLVNSPWGRVLKAIREDEDVARALGKDTFRYKLQAFALGSAIAGLAGAFFAWQLTTLYPDTFNPNLTFRAWTSVVIGGAGHNWGTLLGAALYEAYQTLPRFFPQGWALALGGGRLEALQAIAIGLTLILILLFRPQGLVGRKAELTLHK